MLREPLKAEHIKPRSVTQTAADNDATMTNQIQVTLFAWRRIRSHAMPSECPSLDSCFFFFFFL